MNLWARILIAMKVSYVRQHVALAVLMACASLVALSADAIEWTMLIELDGATNKVTSADKRYAIDVSLVARDGAWSGSVANREKGAIVLGLELTAEPLAVTSGKSALYLPHVYGRRIRNWPEHGVRQKGVDMWTETAKGVFVPFTSKWTRMARRGFSSGTRMTSRRRCLWRSADGSSRQASRNAARWMWTIPSLRTRSVCIDTRSAMRKAFIYERQGIPLGTAPRV